MGECFGLVGTLYRCRAETDARRETPQEPRNVLTLKQRRSEDNHVRSLLQMSKQLIYDSFMWLQVRRVRWYEVRKRVLVCEGSLWFGGQTFLFDTQTESGFIMGLSVVLILRVMTIYSKS